MGTYWDVPTLILSHQITGKFFSSIKRIVHIANSQMKKKFMNVKLETLKTIVTFSNF